MDQEPTFKSSIIQHFFAENQIQYHYTSVGQSSLNGEIEIIHRTVREMHNIISKKESIKTLSETSKINLAVSIYNDSIHSERNVTPKELFYGIKYKVRVPTDLYERIRQK